LVQVRDGFRGALIVAFDLNSGIDPETPIGPICAEGGQKSTPPA